MVEARLMRRATSDGATQAATLVTALASSLGFFWISRYLSKYVQKFFGGRFAAVRA